MVRCCLLGIVAVSLFAPDVHAQEGDPVTIGERHSIASQVLGEDRPYWVYLPASYNDSTYLPQSYPVLYILDGNAHFHSATGVVQFMSTGINGNIQTPELIVVAIPNTDRTRDLTPTQTTRAYDGTEAPGLASSGGGDTFLRFMETELFPAIESTYRTRPYRILVGHSFGGLLALHALVNGPELFKAYIAIDPSLWWDDQLLVRQAEEHFAAERGPAASVYITLANNPNPAGDGPGIMRTSGEAFARSLETASSWGIRSDHRYFENEDHGSVPLLSLYHGLLHTFEGYKPSVARLFEDPASLGPHFEEVSEQMGIEFLPPEGLVDQMGRVMLAQEMDIDKTIELLQLNVANYPSSTNAHQTLGMAYKSAGRPALAKASFERALELDPHNEAAQKELEGLETGG